MKETPQMLFKLLGALAPPVKRSVLEIKESIL